MTPSAIPIRRLQDLQIDAHRDCQKECRSGADTAVCWNIVHEDGSRRQTWFSQPPATPSPPAADSKLRFQPQETGSAWTPGNAPMEAVKNLAENSGEAEGTIGVPLGVRRGFHAAQSGLSSGKSLDSGTKSPSPRFLGLRPVQRASQGQAAQPVGKASVALGKGGIPAAELLACGSGKSVVFPLQECSGQTGQRRQCAGQTRRGKVEMPSARPTLEDEPVDPESLIENLMWTPGQTNPCRMPGVDRRRPFEPVPIEPPTPSPPRLPLETLEAGGAFSDRPRSSAKPAPEKMDRQLRRLMDAWPVVPQHTREAILALIDEVLSGK